MHDLQTLPTAVSVLQHLEVDAIPDTLCSELWDEELYDAGRNICAGRNGTATCKGDSGGPLVKVSQLGQMVQVW